jgi:hypothetical protein
MGQTQSIAVEIVINVATSDNPLGSFKKEWLLIRKKRQAAQEKISRNAVD